MAAAEKSCDSDAPDKVPFKCCKKKVSSVALCIKCGSIFHKSCAKRDWANEINFIDKNRLVCCGNDSEVKSDVLSKDLEISLLKKLLIEMEDKNRILQENCMLWKQKFQGSQVSEGKQNKKIIESIKKNGKQSKSTYVGTGNSIENEVSIDLPVATEQVESLNHSKANGSNASAPNCDNPETNRDRIDIYHIDTDSQLDSTLTSNLTPNPQLTAPVNGTILNGTGVNKPTENNSNNQQNDTAPGLAVVTPSQVSRAVDAALNQQAPGVDKQIGSEEADSWTKVVRKPKHRPSSGRPAPLRGSNGNEGNLKTAPRMAILFLSELAPDVTHSEVLDYLKCNGMGDSCRCEKMQTKKDKHKASFRLIVPQSTLDQYLCSTLWPRDVIINHFMNIQRH